jgi:hypothetical protein
MKKSLLFSCLIAACTSVQATPISLEYQGFYQRLKQVNKGHHPLVELTFSVPNKKLCHINSGSITTEKESFPLTITQDQRIFLPYDGQLKSDRALINLDIEGKVENCNISMQVRAKQTKQNYKRDEIEQVQTGMDTLLSEMQGFPMRYFTAEIAGVNFVFEPDSKVSVKIDGTEQLVSGMLRLSREQIAKLETLELSIKPQVISPWTNG